MIVRKRVRGSCRSGGLTGLSVKDIDRILGFRGNCPDDPYKVKNSWQFEYQGIPCAVWDYKGSEKYNSFSTYGPPIVFEKLFGAAYGK